MRLFLLIAIFLAPWAVCAQIGGPIKFDIEFDRICLVDSVAPDTMTQFWRYTQANNPGGYIIDKTFDLSGVYTPSGTLVPCCACLTDWDVRTGMDTKESSPFFFEERYASILPPGSPADTVFLILCVALLAYILRSSRKTMGLLLLFTLPIGAKAQMPTSAPPPINYDIEFDRICLIDSIAPDTINQFWRYTQANNPGGYIIDKTFDLSGVYTPAGTILSCRDYYARQDSNGIYTGSNFLKNDVYATADNDRFTLQDFNASGLGDTVKLRIGDSVTVLLPLFIIDNGAQFYAESSGIKAASGVANYSISPFVFQEIDGDTTDAWFRMYPSSTNWVMDSPTNFAGVDIEPTEMEMFHIKKIGADSAGHLIQFNRDSLLLESDIQGEVSSIILTGNKAEIRADDSLLIDYSYLLPLDNPDENSLPTGDYLPIVDETGALAGTGGWINKDSLGGGSSGGGGIYGGSGQLSGDTYATGDNERFDLRVEDVSGTGNQFGLRIADSLGRFLTADGIGLYAKNGDTTATAYWSYTGGYPRFSIDNNYDAGFRSHFDPQLIDLQSDQLTFFTGGATSSYFNCSQTNVDLYSLGPGFEYSWLKMFPDSCAISNFDFGADTSVITLALGTIRLKAENRLTQDYNYDWPITAPPGTTDDTFVRVSKGSSGALAGPANDGWQSTATIRQPTFAARHTGSASAVDTSYTPVVFSSSLIKDGLYYTHTDGSDTLTADSAGTYVINATWSFTTSDDAAHLDCILQVDTGSGWTYSPGSRVYLENDQLDYEDVAVSLSGYVISLSAGDRIRMVARRVTSSTTADFEASSLHVVKLE